MNEKYNEDTDRRRGRPPKGVRRICTASGGWLYRYMDGDLWFFEQKNIVVCCRKMCELIFLKHFIDNSQTTARYY